jgi:hypothetical protein
MNTTSRAETPPALLFGRHIVGMALVALLNPLIYYHPSPLFQWLSGWAVAIVFAIILFAGYALFFTERAKRSWPGGVFMLAWVLVILMLIGGWSDYNEIRAGSAARQAERQTAKVTPQPQQQPISQAEWERGKITPPASEIDAFLAAPPSLEEAKLWTQQNTKSSANGPWLRHAPAGSRFCRLHDGAIVVLFPPGVMPAAEQANPFCANDSVDSPDKLGFTKEEAANKDEWWKEDPPVHAAPSNASGDGEWWKKGSTPVNPPQQNHPGLKPFTGKLDGE